MNEKKLITRSQLNGRRTWRNIRGDKDRLQVSDPELQPIPNTVYLVYDVEGMERTDRRTREVNDGRGRQEAHHERTSE